MEPKEKTTRMKPRTLSGFMELLPAPQTQFERILEKLRATYSLYGFTPWTPPSSNRQRSCWPRGRRDREADLPLHQGGQRPGPPL